MKTNSARQEILLVGGTTFSTREFCEPRGGLNYNKLNATEKLVVLWNSFLIDIIPEMFEKYYGNKKIYFCKIIGSSLFLELKLGETYLDLELQSSIDPNAFMPMQILS